MDPDGKTHSSKDTFKEFKTAYIYMIWTCTENSEYIGKRISSIECQTGGLKEDPKGHL